MAEGFIELSPDKLGTHEGVAELNRMIQFLYNAVAGDGELVKVQSGIGSPEGQFVGSVGSLYLRLDGTPGSTLYVKETGTGDTGWVNI